MMQERKSYNTGRAAHAKPPRFEHLIAQLGAGSGFRYAWQQVLPASLQTPGFTVIPGGKSGTVDLDPAISTPNITFVNSPAIVVLLRSVFADTGKTCWIIVASLVY